MSVSRDHLKTVFGQAAEIASADERSRFLDKACSDDPALRAEVEELLAAMGNAGKFLVPRHSLDQTIDSTLAERVGMVIGPYKLLQQIGEGGMGVVYLAEQTEPVQRKVALKVIKPGMDSRQVIARFDAERQALAMMDHVNIARVLDAGATQSGRPYFVMELVHGVPITKYCDDNHLTPRERLELFVPVCQAIQHAHQKGIIHRDIKPSNVMVTLYDGKPVPKVIDFGVAKATEQRLTERTLFTQFGTMVGTLEYMSPEQAEMSALGIDTRSDIYSLGVLLYELLTGSTPLSSKRMKEAAYAEILRVIKEEEPPKPSTRLSDSGEALASISAQRHTEPAKLAKLVRGELDWIVMKTLEKDRNRRYETASGFAADVQRYLNDEPVQACPPSALYRLRKLARRNKSAMAMATIVTALSIVAIVVLSWSHVRVIHERDKKEAALERAQQNLQCALQAVDQMLTRVSEERLVDVPQMTQVRRSLLEDALKFYEQLLKQQSDDSAMLLEFAKAHRRLLEMHTSLRESREAEAAYLRAKAVLESLVDRFPNEASYRHELAIAHNAFGEVLRSDARAPEAEQVLREAIQLASKLSADDAENPRYRQTWGRSQSCLGWVLRNAKRHPESVQALQVAVAIQQQLVDAFPSSREYRFDLAMGCTRLGSQLRRFSPHPEEGEPKQRKAIELLEALVREVPDSFEYRLELAHAHDDLAATQASDRPQQAHESSGTAYRILRNLEEDFPDSRVYETTFAVVCDRLARFCMANGEFTEARSYHEQAIRHMRRRLESDPTYAFGRYSVVNSLNGLASARIQLGDDRGAEAACREAIDSFVALPDVSLYATDAQRALVHSYTLLISILARSGQKEQAQEVRRQALTPLSQAIQKHPEDAKLRRNRGWVQVALGGKEQAQADLAAAGELFHKQGSPKEAIACLQKAVQLKPDDITAHRSLGVAHYSAGDWKATIEALGQSMKLREEGDSFEWFVLAKAHWQLGEKDKAREWYDRAVQWMDKHQPNNEELRGIWEEAAKLLELNEKK